MTGGTTTTLVAGLVVALARMLKTEEMEAEAANKPENR